MSDSDWGSWESKRERAFVVGLEVSADLRLEWLENMLELALAAGALPKPRDPWGRWTPEGKALGESPTDAP
jgi:hypothetical protein